MSDLHIKFSQDLTREKSLKSVNFDTVIQKIKGGRFLGHSVYAKLKFLTQLIARQI